MVREDRAAREGGHPSGGAGPDHFRSGELDAGLFQLDAEHPRLVHQPSALVGPSDSGLLLHELQPPARRRYGFAPGFSDDAGGGNRPRAGDAGRVPDPAGPLREVRRQKLRAGHGCARHLVQLRVVAVQHPRMAEGDPGAQDLLSGLGARDRPRHHLLLGQPDDDDGPPLHEGRALQDRLPARDGARREGREDVQGEGERH